MLEWAFEEGIDCRQGTLLDVFQQLFIAEYIKEWEIQTRDTRTKRMPFSYLEVNARPLGGVNSPFGWEAGFGALLNQSRVRSEDIPLLETGFDFGPIDSEAVPCWLTVLEQLKYRNILPRVGLTAQKALHDAVRESVDQVNSFHRTTNNRSAVKLYATESDNTSPYKYQAYKGDSYFDLISFNPIGRKKGPRNMERSNQHALGHIEYMSKKGYSPFIIGHEIFTKTRQMSSVVYSKGNHLPHLVLTMGGQGSRGGTAFHAVLFYSNIPHTWMSSIVARMSSYIGVVGSIGVYGVEWSKEGTYPTPLHAF